jgi:hypothetical protein
MTINDSPINPAKKSDKERLARRRYDGLCKEGDFQME